MTYHYGGGPHKKSWWVGEINQTQFKGLLSVVQKQDNRLMFFDQVCTCGPNAKAITVVNFD